MSQLQMLGYDVSWAAFNIVEVMSSSKFTYKVKLEYTDFSLTNEDSKNTQTGCILYYRVC